MPVIRITKLPNGTFNIDASPEDKASYSVQASIEIDGTAIITGTTSSVLPYNTILQGVQNIKLTLRAVNSTKVTTICYLADDVLYCKILERLASLSQEELSKDSTPALYWMLMSGIENDGCICSCPNLKNIYSDLLEIVNPQKCC